MKLIHEARFGPPKCWKTGSVLASYPKPMLVFMWDKGGHEIERSIKPEHIVDIAKFKELVKKPMADQFPITVLDLSFKATEDLEWNYQPAKDASMFDNTIQGVNLIRKLSPFPWKTVVGDPITELSNAIWSHQAVNNAGALGDPRKWASNIGMKVGQVINYFHSFQCNTVMIFHSEVNVDEVTKKVTEQPMVYSNLRNSIGGMFTQFFYQCMIGGVPKVKMTDFELARGIGARWPKMPTDATMADPTFNAIYGKEEGLLK